METAQSNKTSRNAFIGGLVFLAASTNVLVFRESYRLNHICKWIFRWWLDL
jgi:hypothetical protein